MYGNKRASKFSKGVTTVQGCHCLDDMAVHMRDVLANWFKALVVNRWLVHMCPLL